ncbi:MAG: hypothetical protein JWN29_2082 [Acidimicrobiales bacterium]|nr:hypothetical protein [Acidimicrobiales bacterium]
MTPGSASVARRGRYGVVAVICLVVAPAVIGEPQPAQAQPSGIQVSAQPQLTRWQGAVERVRPQSFDLNVDVVWSPDFAFDIGTRTVTVTPATVFDPPGRCLDNLEVGEEVTAVVTGDGTAVEVTVVDTD